MLNLAPFLAFNITLFKNIFALSRKTVSELGLPSYLSLLPPTVIRISCILFFNNCKAQMIFAYVILASVGTWYLGMKKIVFVSSTYPSFDILFTTPWTSLPNSLESDFVHMSPSFPAHNLSTVCLVSYFMVINLICDLFLYIRLCLYLLCSGRGILAFFTVYNDYHASEYCVCIDVVGSMDSCFQFFSFSYFIISFTSELLYTLDDVTLNRLVVECEDFFVAVLVWEQINYIYHIWYLGAWA